MMLKSNVLVDCNHVVVGVARSEWENGTEVVVLTPAELEAKLKEARAESDGDAVNSVRRKIFDETGKWPVFRPYGMRNKWECGDVRVDGQGHEDLPLCMGDTPLAAAQSLLAAVQAAQEPCPCKSAKWRPEDDCWYMVARKHTCNEGPQFWLKPSYHCPDCGDPLPPKPVSAMTIEECADECPDWWFADADRYGWRVYDRYGDPKGRGLPMAVVDYPNYEPTCLKAWQAATRKFREEATS